MDRSAWIQGTAQLASEPVSQRAFLPPRSFSSDRSLFEHVDFFDTRYIAEMGKWSVLGIGDASRANLQAREQAHERSKSKRLQTDHDARRSDRRVLGFHRRPSCALRCRSKRIVTHSHDLELARASLIDSLKYFKAIENRPVAVAAPGG